ncbi:hypothetical protein AVEN_89610-1 [Araneus ventricosus]|uniref:Uncharacterized protein n=1 Tax=Araneus ventricosus TaxID=182803 RepID=A0A4Y2L6F1_ARAVE|nr:hypothetical protein AVEN_89610-1 [Araneus ventricosus]
MIGRTLVMMGSSPVPLVMGAAIMRSAAVPVFLSRPPVFQYYPDANTGRYRGSLYDHFQHSSVICRMIQYQCDDGVGSKERRFGTT